MFRYTHKSSGVIPKGNQSDFPDSWDGLGRTKRTNERADTIYKILRNGPCTFKRLHSELAWDGSRHALTSVLNRLELKHVKIGSLGTAFMHPHGSVEELNRFVEDYSSTTLQLRVLELLLDLSNCLSQDITRHLSTKQRGGFRQCVKSLERQDLITTKQVGRALWLGIGPKAVDRIQSLRAKLNRIDGITEG